MNVAIVQCKREESFEANLSKAASFFAEAKGCDCIVFPEYFLKKEEKRGYSHQATTIAKERFASLCRLYRMHGVMGSIAEKRNSRFYNTSYLFDDKGNALGRYDKINLERGEREWITPGRKVACISTRFGLAGIQICRDLLYPQITQDLAQKGAKLVFCPTRWCSYSARYPKSYLTRFTEGTLPKEMQALAEARAIESCCAFILANAAGETPKEKLLGRSSVSMPFYGTVAILNHNREGILAHAIDKKLLNSASGAYGKEKGREKRGVRSK
ncbi:TPA: carbon-nitrogen hydrolase family protein [Candidatus Woesearchaeota archaeon]|nr:carbon-nitrogen hydrolase family protein [Candidatus Woesearchaeota archaeon]HII68568.1 carbon-nitrogen hydrolase family protein [Candidatus Woesearchaeota archaeon]